MIEETKREAKNLWSHIRSRLAAKGIYVGVNRLEDLGDLGLEDLADLDIEVDLGEKGDGVKVVCVAPDLKTSAEAMSGTSRDHVVMVRVDEETRDALDAWVKTGAVKSRSEAAALFIREGLAVRADELERLREALREVEEAQERLRRKAREVFGGDDEEDEPAEAETSQTEASQCETSQTEESQAADTDAGSKDPTAN